MSKLWKPNDLRKPTIPGGHKPFDYTKLLNLQELGNALRDIHSDIETALDAIDTADRHQSVTDHMRASMILSGLEIKMSNFAAAMRALYLNRQ